MSRGTMSTTNAAHARPFLKWAGGKTQLLPQLLPHVPKTFGRYFEPFVGGGALFFHLAPAISVISDSNERLVRTYRAIRDSVEEVISLLEKYPHTSEFFYELRSLDIDSATDVKVAAWLIYLNKTCFNGLYRVNRKNSFNVPFGKYKNPNYCDKENLRACSKALAHTDILCSDFELATSTAYAGDFVYFDPPYVPLSTTSSFTSYTENGFDENSQRRLVNVFGQLKEKDVYVLLSNSTAALGLYREFDVLSLRAKRNVNCKGDKRGSVLEILARGNL